jgi:enoyl-CoA hydratase/carnithine racemase
VSEPAYDLVLRSAPRPGVVQLTLSRPDAAEALRIGLVTDVVQPHDLAATVDTTIDVGHRPPRYRNR